MGPDLADINGVVTSTVQARVPILDRGFLFGDAVYEVVRFYNGQPFQLKEHLARLQRSWQGLEMTGVPPQQELYNRGTALIQKSGRMEGRLYYQITRGVGTHRTPVENETLTPNVVILVEAIVSLSEETYASGVDVITVPEKRWHRSDLKTTNLIPRILVRKEAKQQGAYEALWVDSNGHIREGTSTNVFALIGGIVVTPPLVPGLVPGITRSAVLETAAETGVPTQQTPIGLAALKSADEVFLTGTSPEVLGVRRIDKEQVGEGFPGPVTQALHRAYRNKIRCGSTPRRPII